jgi:hypothetical protein
MILSSLHDLNYWECCRNKPDCMVQGLPEQCVVIQLIMKFSVVMEPQVHHHHHLNSPP